MIYVLLFSVFIISTCGLIYELIAGALASYLLGDSITQFSTVIGSFLFSMGIGAYLSKHVNKNLIYTFILVELIIGMVGGFSATILFIAFEYIVHFRILLYLIVGIIGTFVGFEIPILMRILQNNFAFKDLVAKVFTFDYVGALIASILFPLFLVPHLGLIKTALVFGIINVLIAIWAIFIFKNKISNIRTLQGTAFCVLSILIVGIIFSDKLVEISEKGNYQDKIIYSKSSKYQKIVLTKSTNEFKLYLNRNLQFNSKDEYRYHESLVHIGLSSINNPKNVLILGGGDGLAVREILKYNSIEKITLVELDSEITEMFSKNNLLTKINSRSLLSEKVNIINADAFVWLKENKKKFDFIVVDFPDPSNFSIGKLYTNSFYRLLYNAIENNGLAVIQSTSPYVAKKSFWCVNNTLRSVGFLTYPYHVYIPSFGDWGYILVAKNNFQVLNQFPKDLKFINYELAKTFFHFPQDSKVEVNEINKLNNQILVRYFEQEWSDYVQ
ncbi:polyamine aminopropyltransferase [Pigmentibacter sp. JX0631]|uniref:polyamine aminopropyltransferase n=1 Tax=Pigmentibacter sp. JX0631 TaxID=2976982 RepID=UPI002469BEA5|nr:polyamine aminopropyltransferase [Pigmentibacter sp. JX0631]WGL58915.1 polyamine aminopropyltransferase [Pigmentibacter sp. JX0631]